MTTNMEISIREETIRKLRLDKNPTFLLLLKQAVEQFCEYTYLDATSTLFTLLYEDNKHFLNKALMSLNFTISSEDSFEYECFFIERESVRPIAEELQFQYMAAHPYFLEVKDCPNCEEELSALKSVLANQPILLYRAVDSVWNTLNNAENAQNCIHLLLSDTEKVQAKGLEKMNHNLKHQRLLLPYAKEIGLLLKAMLNRFKEENQRLVSVSPEERLVMEAQEELNALKSSPFAPLAKIWDKVPAEAEVKLAPKTPTVTDEKPNKCPLIKEYSVSPELSKLLDKKDIIEAVLTAYKDLEAATDNLIKVDADYEKLAAQFRKDKDNIEILHALFAAGNARQEAKLLYNTAYDSFVEHCDAFENAVSKS